MIGTLLRLCGLRMGCDEGRWVHKKSAKVGGRLLHLGSVEHLESRLLWRDSSCSL